MFYILSGSVEKTKKINEDCQPSLLGLEACLDPKREH